jgi:predicted small lipoprotein YifL
MQKTLLVWLALSLATLAGCGSETVTQIPDSLSEAEIAEMEAHEMSVEQQERQHRQQQRQPRRTTR